MKTYNIQYFNLKTMKLTMDYDRDCPLPRRARRGYIAVCECSNFGNSKEFVNDKGEFFATLEAAIRGSK